MFIPDLPFKKIKAYCTTVLDLQYKVAIIKYTFYSNPFSQLSKNRKFKIVPIRSVKG